MSAKEKSLFDTHVHLDIMSREIEIEDELHLARQKGIGSFLVPGVDRSGWDRLVDLCKHTGGALAAPGLHPQHADQWNPEAVRALERLCDKPQVIAIGEIGLDHTLSSPSHQEQERVFVAQLHLAIEARLPVVIHCRNAIGSLLEILRRERADRVGGILHGFSGSLESARQAVDLGFAIGLGAPLTYPEARKAPQIGRDLDSRWLVLETDAPDRAPHPYRGQTNRPCWLLLVAKALAELRGWDLEKTAAVTTANARRVLGLGGK